MRIRCVLRGHRWSITRAKRTVELDHKMGRESRYHTRMDVVGKSCTRCGKETKF